MTSLETDPPSSAPPVTGVDGSFSIGPVVMRVTAPPAVDVERYVVYLYLRRVLKFCDFYY